MYHVNTQQTSYPCFNFKGCDEGDVIRVSCNSCVCVNTQYVCSKKDCMEPEIPLPPKMKGSSNKKKGTLNYNKKADQSATIDEAGNVLYGEYFSSEAGDLAMAEGEGNGTIVREDDLLSSELSCIDGRIKPVDCNHCICAMGKWACTKDSCIPLSLREKASFHGAEFIKKADTLKENLGIDGMQTTIKIFIFERYQFDKQVRLED